MQANIIKNGPGNMRISPSGKMPSIKKETFAQYMQKNWQLYLLLLFPVVVVFIFKYLPLMGLSVAFLDYDPISGFAAAKFIGLDAFKEVFKSKDFYIVLRNTLMLNFLDLLTGFPAPIILAILLNEVTCKWFKKTTQTLLYLPHFLSWVVIAAIFYQLLSPQSGILNIVIANMGGHSIPFLTEKWHWLITYNVIGVWQGMGWGTIIYLAAITGISGDLYEAATVDGAGRWAKIWHITLPCLKPTIVTLLILQLGRILGISFERPYTLGNSIVQNFSDVISTYVYRVGLQSFRYNISTAVGLFQSVIGFILVLITDKVSKKMGESGLL